MKNRWYATAAVGTGLLAAEIIASIHIFLSNQWLHEKISVLASAGYLTLPNPATVSTLNHLKPAILGGLFFVFTIGAGLSMAVFFSTWAWDRLFSRSKKAGAALLAIWIVLIAGVNMNGFNPAAFCHMVIIPLAVCIVTLKLMPAEKTSILGRNTILHIITVLLPAILILGMMDGAFYINVRDHLLLSNKPGEAVNRFYYKYTLYPAETLKPLKHKSLKSVYPHAVERGTPTLKLEKAFRMRDYLWVKKNIGADLIMEMIDNHLVFKQGKAIIMDVNLSDFMKNPDVYLDQFSDRIDRNKGFRQLVFYSLVAGFPILLYLFLFTISASIFDLFMEKDLATPASICFCLAMALGVLFILYQAKPGALEISDTNHALTLKNPMERAAIFRKINTDRLEVAFFKGYEKSVSSPFVPERYWLARSLGFSKKAKTYPVLILLLNDSNPNVVCQALWSLGQRKKKVSITRIIDKLETTRHWYIQWYAYRALRTLGWIQKKSV